MSDITQLWDNATFTEATPGDWDTNPIQISPNVNNSNGAYNSVDIVLDFHTFVPDGETVQMGSVIAIVLEEEISPGVWVPVAQGGDAVKGSDDPLKQVIKYGPQVIVDPTPIKIAEGPKVISTITHTDGILGEQMRIRLQKVVTNGDRAQHTSITVSAYAREYDR